MACSERNAEIIRRRRAGELPYEIAAAMGLTRNAVIGVCNRANLCGIEPGAQSRALKARANPPRGEAQHLSKLTDEIVREVRRSYVPRDPIYGVCAMARRLGVSRVVIWRARTGRTWAHVA